jgi:YegS/Rv2252/BmrU family lipid kinase
VDCILLYNPVSGRNRERRAAQIARVAAALSSLGHRVDTMSTSGPGTAAVQAAKAPADAVIFACGGDGTVHEVLQGLVSEDRSPRAILGVIPVGSANVLARHLGLSLDPVRAALQQIQGAPTSVPAGKIVFGGSIRYFLSLAGAGPDGALARSVSQRQKWRLGRITYYVHAARLFAARRFPPFEVEFTRLGTAQRESVRAIAAMAIRVGNLGGVFGGIAPRGASIDEPCFRLSVLKPPARLSLPLWFLSAWLRAPAINPFLTLVEATGFSCRDLNSRQTEFQADGEWLGSLPFRVSMVPDALRIPLPASAVRSGAQFASAQNAAPRTPDH